MLVAFGLVCVAKGVFGDGIAGSFGEDTCFDCNDWAFIEAAMALAVAIAELN